MTTAIERDPEMPDVAAQAEAIERDAAAAVAALEADLATRPRWRRPRQLNRKVTTALVFTSALAVAVFGVLNFFAARDLLVEGTEEQLEAIAAGRSNSVERGLQGLIAGVSATSSDLGIVRALEDFTRAFNELELDPLTPSQFDELESFYEETLISGLAEAGLGEITADEVIPASNAGQYVQYHYTVPAGADGEAPIDPGDGSLYTEFNVDYQDFLSTAADVVGGGDLLLISAEGDGEIVYTVDKRIDVGTNLATGPYRDSNLASAIIDQLPRTRAGDAVVTDFQIYIPAGGEPVMFAVSAVRDGTEVIGALAVEVPITGLNVITAADGSWEEVGLNNGESYIVSSGRLLQSESRLWIEDPEEYLDRLRDGSEETERLAELIELFGSPVGIQPVNTTAVDRALEGEAFTGTSTNYLGQATYTTASALSVPGVQWVVVTEVPQDDATEPLFDYLQTIILVILVLVPASALVGIVLARRLTRPIGPTVDAAARIAAGERDPQLDENRRDEFGDLGRRLNAMARNLQAQETELRDEYERKRALLLAVLPPQLVGRDGDIADAGVAADEATVVAITIALRNDEYDVADTESAEVLHVAAAAAERLATDAGLDRVRVAADRSLFVSGVGEDTSGADDAVVFARRFVHEIDQLGRDQDVVLDAHIGLSTGAVATGVLERGSLTFGAWGEPVRRSLAISALSQRDQVLLDTPTIQALTPGRWLVEPATDVVDLDDEPMNLSTLIGPALAEDGADVIGGPADDAVDSTTAGGDADR